MTLNRPLHLIMMLLLAIAVAGCSSTGDEKGGGYYKDDGPDANPPSNLDQCPTRCRASSPTPAARTGPTWCSASATCPTPPASPIASRASRLVRQEIPRQLHLDRRALRHVRHDGGPHHAAGAQLRPGDQPVNGRTVIVRVNDRGPFHSDRIMDLSYVAAYKLGIIGPQRPVVVESIGAEEIRRLASQGPPRRRNRRPPRARSRWPSRSPRPRSR